MTEDSIKPLKRSNTRLAAAFGILFYAAVSSASLLPEKLEISNTVPASRDFFWITFSPGADIPDIKKDIEATGGTIIALAPEMKLLARHEPTRAGVMRSIRGVENVRALHPVIETPGPPGRGLGDRPPTPEEEAVIRRAVTQVIRIEPNQLSVLRAGLEGLDTTPGMADNSLSMHFPPIRSQGGQGSCTAWAAAYYYNTYTQAKDEGLDVSGGNNDRICSPAFLYNLINRGTDGGASVGFAMTRLNEIGTSSWSLQPYNASDHTTWPTEAAWVEALNRRTQSAFVIGNWNSGCTDDQLQAIKQHLANGYIATTRTQVYSNWYSLYPQNTTGVHNGVLYANSGDDVGGHAMTIVGYDDDKSYFDGTTTRTGAFLIANSWGSSWGVANTSGTGKGFMWVAYDFFKEGNSCFGAAWFNSDRPLYRPRVYAVTGLNHAQRGYVQYRGGVGSPQAPAWTSHYAINNAGGTVLAVSDARPIAVDLTDGFSTIPQPEATLFTQMNLASSASGSGTISNALFYIDFQGNGSYNTAISTDPTVSVAPGQSGFATVVFTVPNNPPNKPEPVSPANGATGVGLTPILQASAFSDPDGDGHANSQWQVDDNGAFSSPEWDSGMSYAAGTQVTVPSGRLNYGTQYHWRVRYKDSRGAWSAWSDSRMFTTEDDSRPVIGLNRSSLRFGAEIGGSRTQSQQVIIGNSGEGVLNWTATAGSTWLRVIPGSGSGVGAITVSVEAAGLSAGTYTGQVAVEAADAANSPRTISVTLEVYAAGASAPPLGIFDTPEDGAVVFGAIPVTGWVLDDIQTARVEIKRSPHPSDPPSVIGPDGLVFISDAVFVEGARPDIETSYPQYPLNYRAGWGYMMLTNMLPNQGNGSFTIHAFAHDREGACVKLGQKTITSDNENSEKPFGTIDTPVQGGTISGASFLNFGWALTPLPNMIPTNGSTIWVFVDGQPVGQPSYNHRREDIATLFPGLLNSEGAVGLFHLDTTVLENDVHTIAWGVVDNAGNAEGIGSRYFNVLNIESSSTGELSAPGQTAVGPKDDIRNRPRRDFTAAVMTWNEIMAWPVHFEGVRVRRGYSVDGIGDIVRPDSRGVVRLSIPEVERIEVTFGDALENGRISAGFLVVGGELRPLPIGSLLDPRMGVFTWQPGPGFLGVFDFIFLCEYAGGRKDRIILRIDIIPSS